MRDRKVHHFDLGEAISMEDAISMMTIIFVLFVIFLVPLVSIDKARLEAKKVDHFWAEAVSFLGTRSSRDFDQYSLAYRNAFDLERQFFVRTTHLKEGGRQFRFVESLLADSSLIVIRHNLENNNFNSMLISKNGETATFRHGLLEQIDSSREWFSAEDDFDYGDDPRSKELNRDYRRWRTQSMKGTK